MKLRLFKNQYRVLEVFKDGDRKFFPQERHLYFFWKNIIQDGFEYLKEQFSTLEQAEAFLFDYQRTEFKREQIKKVKQAEKKLNKKTGHPFNATFYKLKKTEDHEQ